MSVFVFVNAWVIAHARYHNKCMEAWSNPTPEALRSREFYWVRLKRLHKWSNHRWGDAVQMAMWQQEYGRLQLSALIEEAKIQRDAAQPMTKAE